MIVSARKPSYDGGMVTPHAVQDVSEEGDYCELVAEVGVSREEVSDSDRHLEERGRHSQRGQRSTVPH